MQARQMKQELDRIEQCADDAKNALATGNVPQALRESVETLHRQASQAKHRTPAGDEQALRDALLQLESCADRALQACRNAGAGVDERLRQAVQRAHDELSGLKKRMQADAAA